MATALAVREEAPVTREQILAELKLNPSDPKTALAVALCQRYGLDPVLKHVLVVNGNVYVTRDGLLYVAHKSGQLDGMEVLDMGETQSHYTARVAVYRKDMSRPFVYPGRYPKGGSNKAFGPEMAVKVSEVMGLRRAFSIAASVLEERWDMEEAQPTQTRPVEAPRQVDRSTGEILDVESAPAPESIPGVKRGAGSVKPDLATPQSVQYLQMVAQAGGKKLAKRDDKLAFFAWAVGRDSLETTKDLTKKEANTILAAVCDERAFAEKRFEVDAKRLDALLDKWYEDLADDFESEMEDHSPPADPDEGRPRE